MKVLITGGAGFIGSRLAHRLAAHGHEVTIIDKLTEQVHGSSAHFSAELNGAARCLRADVAERELLLQELRSTETVVHLAAETGTGQSMYAVDRYSRDNIQATAVLLDVIVNERPKNLKKIVVASSRAIYGEGAYRCDTHGIVYPPARSFKTMSEGKFDPVCPTCAASVQVSPTPEDAPHAPSSFYGLTKQVQEQMVLMFAEALGIEAIALRYQNVYGPGQSLSNPYTGLLAVFFNLARAGNKLNVFEDGLESRDFIYIDDVVEATLACVEKPLGGRHAMNIGSGVRTAVMEVATSIVGFFGARTPIQVSGDFRVGDIRHNVADISRAKSLIGFAPKWEFARGLHEFMRWAQSGNASGTGFAHSMQELQQRGMLGHAR